MSARILARVSRAYALRAAMPDASDAALAPLLDLPDALWAAVAATLRALDDDAVLRDIHLDEAACMQRLARAVAGRRARQQWDAALERRRAAYDRLDLGARNAAWAAAFNREHGVFAALLAGPAGDDLRRQLVQTLARGRGLTRAQVHALLPWLAADGGAGTAAYFARLGATEVPWVLVHHDWLSAAEPAAAFAFFLAWARADLADGVCLGVNTAGGAPHELAGLVHALMERRYGLPPMAAARPTTYADADTYGRLGHFFFAPGTAFDDALGGTALRAVLANSPGSVIAAAWLRQEVKLFRPTGISVTGRRLFDADDGDDE